MTRILIVSRALGSDWDHNWVCSCASKNQSPARPWGNRSHAMLVGLMVTKTRENRTQNTPSYRIASFGRASIAWPPANATG